MEYPWHIPSFVGTTNVLETLRDTTRLGTLTIRATVRRGVGTLTATAFAGHNPTDFQPFKNLFDFSDTFYTNAELYEKLEPNLEILPYMYDNFQWPHCEKIGISISNKF